MSERVLYREWRPLNFDQVVGQEHVVAALRQATISEEIAHAYIFSGTRGTGKTSLAKIYARAINCTNTQENANPCNACNICTSAIKGNLLDIIEMDAASNNSVDDIRKITDEVMFLPSLTKYKVYIIDEAHMLSTAAFNALLKTLEEPPAHAVFILATTEPQRIPATILSRCQRYDFKRIKPEQMLNRLKLIAEENNIAINDDALMTINVLSEGALRDAISLLDQARNVYSGNITRDDILAMSGIISDDFLEEIIFSLLKGDVDELMQGINTLILEGGDLSRFVTSLSQYMRNLLIYNTTKNPENILQAPSRTLSSLGKLSPLYSSQELIEQITFLSNLQQDLKHSETPRITLEVNLIQLLQNVARDDIGETIHDSLISEKPFQDIKQIQPLQAKQTRQGQVPKPSVTIEGLDSTEEQVMLHQEGAIQSRNNIDTITVQEIKQIQNTSTLKEQVEAEQFSETREESNEPQETNTEKNIVNEEETVVEKANSNASAMGFLDLNTILDKKNLNKSDNLNMLKKEVENDYYEDYSGNDNFNDSENFAANEDFEIQRNIETSGNNASYEDNRSWEFSKQSKSSEYYDDNFDDKEVNRANYMNSSTSEEIKNVKPNINLSEMWQNFLENLSQTDPLFSILLNSCKHFIKADKFIIEFSKKQKHIYDKIVEDANDARVQSSFKQASMDSGLRLKYLIEGSDPALVAENEEFEHIPEWVERMHKIAKQMDIPVKDEI